MGEIEFVANAPSPDGGGSKMISLNIEPERVKQLASLGRKTALFELVYNVLGHLPPVNNIGYHEQGCVFPDHWGGMKHTHAIFRGLNRPMNDHLLDGNVYVYLIAPLYTYQYVPDMVCCAKRCDAPRDAVFAIYVTFDNEDYNKGVILNWEWIGADPKNPKFPRDFEERYDERVWTNG